MESADKPGLISVGHNPNKGNVNSKVSDYLTVYDRQISDAERREEFLKKGDGGKVVTNHYYDLATDFYEYGWGESFHFAPLYKGESREHSFCKHEYRLALRLGLGPKDEALVSNWSCTFEHCNCFHHCV